MSVPNSPHNLEALNQVVRGLKALDDSRTSKAIVVRNVSMQLLFVSYLIDLFFSFGLVTTGAVVLFGMLFVSTQAYITIQFQRKANYSLKEWIFLFKNRSRLSKIFIILGIGLILFLFLELIVLLTVDIPQIEAIHENVFYTTALILFMITFIFTTLLEQLSNTILRYRVRQYQLRGMDAAEVGIEMNEETNDQYHRLAIDILTDASVLQHPQKQAEKQKNQPDYEKFDVKMDGQDGDAVPSSPSPAKQEALRQSAIEKLESIGADTDSLALGPDELDALTEEEIDALLPNNSSAGSKEHKYRWELTDK